MAESYPVYEQQPRRRGRKLLIALLVLLVILVGLLAVLDRVALGVAERAIAERAEQQIAQQQISSSKPEVSIAGFPFLTQVAAGHYDSITIDVHDAAGPVQDREVRLPRLEIVARDVDAPLSALRAGTADVRAGTVDSTATIAYDSVAQYIKQRGVQLREQNGKLAVTGPITLLGRKFTYNGIGELIVDKGQLRLKFDDLTVEGLTANPIAAAALASYAKQISIKVPLPELPYGMRVHEVKPLPEGLQVIASASDVPLGAAS